MDYLEIEKVSVPSNDERVYKDECSYCFDSQKSPTGIYTCMSCFQAFCGRHLNIHTTEKCFGQRYFVHFAKYVQEKKVNEAEMPEKKEELEEGPFKKRKSGDAHILGFGVAGGFSADIENDEESICSISIFDNKTQIEQPFPSEGMPETLVLSATGIISAQSIRIKDEIKAWKDENILQTSQYAMNLFQVPAGDRRIKPYGEKCQAEGCDMKDNLWLNLTDGLIFCGRRNWDGTGGNGHALKHYEETGYPIVVKLGTITAEGADVMSYIEDDMVKDPLLEEHLCHWGINMMSLKKVDKSMIELTLDLNQKYDFSRIQEDGYELIPLHGKGFTGLQNLGNTCYMNSLIQVVFSIPRFRDAYGEKFRSMFWTNSHQKPDESFHIQMLKLADGILSGRYSHLKNDEDGNVSNYQEGIAPHFFKKMISTGNADFSGSQQQDVLEFYMHFMNKIADNEKSVGRSEEDPSNLFRFKLCDLVTDVNSSSSCSSKISRNECFLSIPIIGMSNLLSSDSESKVDNNVETSRDRVSFENCLTRYFSDEILGSSGRKKKTFFEEVPQILAVHLQKFFVDDSWTPKKLDIFVDFPQSIDLSTFVIPSSSKVSESRSIPTVDQSVVNQLTDMGFPTIKIYQALISTGNIGAESALEWLMSNEDPPDGHVAILLSLGFSEVQIADSLIRCNNNLENAILQCTNTSVDTETVVTGNVSDEEQRGEYYMYKLFAFISHMGSSAHCGHYVCHILDENSGKWILFNDSRVCQSQKPPFDMGYMYFLKRIE